MFELDTWFMAENRGNKQKEVEAIELPYKCGKIEAEIIMMRYFNHQPRTSYMHLSPNPVRVL
jgi:hypothetical protein